MDALHRIKITEFPPEETRTLELEGPEVRHLQVLRHKIGDIVRVFDGKGVEFEAQILELNAFTATLELREQLENNRETPQPITLAIALLKGDKLADVVRQSTELGVTTIQLLKTQFSDVPDIKGNKLLRLQRIAEEASKQSRRSVTPTVLEPIGIKQLLEVKNGFVAHPESRNTLLERLHWDAPLWIASGPEGGFSPLEVQMLQNKGFTAISLGQRILRAETAPLAMLGAIAATGV